MEDEARKLGTAIARQLYAMVSNKGKKLQTPRGQFTCTDEYVDKYLFGRRPRPGSALIRQKYGEG